MNRLYLLPLAASAIVLFAACQGEDQATSAPTATAAAATETAATPAAAEAAATPAATVELAATEAAATPAPTAVLTPAATEAAATPAPTAVVAPVASGAPEATIEPTAKPISGNFGTDIHLELAVIQDFDLDDDEEEFVLFSFRDRVQEITDPDGFFVAGFESSVSETAQTLRILEDDEQSVLAGFPAGTDLQQFSVAGVSAGVVRNVQDEINLPTTVGLEGATSSLNSRPQLLEVTNLDTTLNRATFVFSDNLDESDITAEEFGYYTQSGLAHTADLAVSIEDQNVIVEWDEEDGDEVEDAVRFYVADGAVLDRQGFGNLIGAIGDNTSAPDLEDVDNISRGLWSFSFDEAVVPLNPGDFILYTQDGDRFTGDDFASVSTDEVDVVFRVVENFADQVTFAAVSPGAVRSISADGATNTYGSKALGGGVVLYIGVTAGPDLLTVAPEAADGIISFTFDQEIDDDVAIDQQRFYLMTGAGEIIRARAIIEVDEDRVGALFDETLAEAAVAAGVLAGAVVDENGNPNLDRALIQFGTSLVLPTDAGDDVDTLEEDDEDVDTLDQDAG